MHKTFLMLFALFGLAGHVAEAHAQADYKIVTGPERGTYIYFRYDDRKTVMVALNSDRNEAALTTQRFHEMLPPNASGTDVITGKTYDLASKLTVPARSALILEIK